MKTLNLLGLIFLILLSGCNNPLDESGVGKSTVQDGYNYLLNKPSSFSFTHFDMQSGEVTLYWGTSLRADSYEVLYGTSSGNYSTTATCTSSPCNITGLTNSTTYYFTVIASNLRGSTSVSSEISVTPVDAPTVPGSVTATSANGSVALSWGSSTGNGTIRYKVLRSTTSGIGYSEIVTNLSGTTHTDSTVTNGTTYYYVVRSFNQYGEGTNSSEVVGTPMAPPAAPGGVTATSALAQINLSWSASTGSGTKTYSVYRSTTSGSGFSQIATSLSGLTFSDTGRSAGTTYYYHIIATNLVGDSPASSEVSAAPYQTFALNIPFDSGTSSSYTFSDSSVSEFFGGVFRLTPVNQTDNSASTFPTGMGIQYDGTNNYVRLNTTTNTSELDSSWTPQWDNLKAYYCFNGTGSLANAASIGNCKSKGSVATALDGSGGTSTMQYNASGKVGSSVNFGGLNRGVILPYNSGMDQLYNDNGFTFVGWIKPTISSFDTTGDNDYRWIFFNWGDAFRGYHCLIEQGGDLSCSIFTGPTAYRYKLNCGKMNNMANKWTHIAMVASAADGFIRVYINGLPSCSMSFASTTLAPPVTPGSWRLGYNSGTSEDDFIGDFDEFAFYSSKLSADEVRHIYERQSGEYSGNFESRIMDAGSEQGWTSLQSLTTLPFGKELTSMSVTESTSTTNGYSGKTSNLSDGLVGLWHLNETSGSTVTDSSGRNNHGVAYNGVSTNNCAATGTSSNCKGAKGIFGQAANFTGTVATSEYINIPNSSTLENVQEWDSTYSAWVYLHAWPTYADNTYHTDKGGGILIKTGSHFGLVATGAGVQMQTWDASNVNRGAYASGMSLRKWFHVVGVLDITNSAVKIYVDGVLKQTTSLPMGFNTRDYATATFKIGTATPCSPTSQWCNPLNGQVDEVAIWNRALSTNDIKELYRRGANRVKYQVRTCSTSDCSEGSKTASNNFGWQGPNGTVNTYFSELTNATANSLNASFTVPNNQYFQYRAVLESDDINSLCNYGGAASCSPELKAVSIGPDHYPVTNPYVTNNTSIGSLYQALTKFEVNPTATCTGDRYTVSGDGTNFWYYSGGWVLSNGSYNQASSSSQIHSNIGTLVAVMGVGTLQVRTYLNSDGATPCEVGNVLIEGQKY